MANLVYGFKPTKNTAFTFYYGVTREISSNSAFGFNEVTTTNSISKDGGAFATPANSPVFIGDGSSSTRSLYSLTLTATEMNADIICVQLRADDSTDGLVVDTHIIYTTTDAGGEGSGLTTYSPAVLTSIVHTIAKGYSLSQVASAESSFNYYQLTHPTNPWWLIIKEATDFSTVGYAMKHNNTQSSTDGWTNRASLSYSDNFPLANL